MMKYIFKNTRTQNLCVDYGYGHYQKNGFTILKDKRGKDGGLYNNFYYQLVGMSPVDIF